MVCGSHYSPAASSGDGLARTTRIKVKAPKAGVVGSPKAYDPSRTPQRLLNNTGDASQGKRKLSVLSNLSNLSKYRHRKCRMVHFAQSRELRKPARSIFPPPINQAKPRMRLCVVGLKLQGFFVCRNRAGKICQLFAHYSQIVVPCRQRWTLLHGFLKQCSCRVQIFSLQSVHTIQNQLLRFRQPRTQM